MKIKISLVFLIISVVIGYSNENYIKIKSLRGFYDEVINKVPLFRYINSKEGMGMEYTLEVLSKSITSNSTDLNIFLNSPVEFFTNKSMNYEYLLNPNYIHFLNDLLKTSSSIYIGNTKINVLKDVFNIFNIKNLKISKDSSEMWIGDQKPVSNSKYIVSGKINNFLNEKKDWYFVGNEYDKSFSATFTTLEKNFESKTTFDIDILKDKKIFGEVLDIFLLQKNKFLNYIREFFVPMDEDSSKALEELTESIDSKEFLTITSRNISNLNDITLFIQANLNKNKLSIIANKRRMKSGKIGTYYYYEFTYSKAGTQIYVYYNDEDFLISTIKPSRMKIYFGESPRFKLLNSYKALKNRKNLERVLMIDLVNYIEKNFYGSINSFVNVSFFKKEKNYIVNVTIK
ncbi:hypothetical protein OSSY52_02660 [Tepiditoga spiralis]|uniref:Uncharacterized protein n=1 Tax=Tepiditoga spiralis TaxID=2108365 RepID=A0A7G1G2N2_9BACT|nr:hypothetical protein [Tepiditoga spiralis]BBE30125.1 hypothetical protein OSSY52_02660 [Tepiditoga spiralis]